MPDTLPPASASPDPTSVPVEGSALPMWFPDPVFDPDAVLVRDPAEEAFAEERLAEASAEFARLGPVAGAPRDVPDRLRIPQVNRYACGPAVAEILIRAQGAGDLDGVALDQEVLAGADHLGLVVHGGTRWIHNVMASTLRRWLPGSGYVATPAPTPDALRAIVAWSTRRSRLVAAEVRQVPGGLHLPGHPLDSELCHWLVIVGFDATTDEVVMIDPAASPHVSWSASVPAVSRVAVRDIAAMTVHHGVVW